MSDPVETGGSEVIQRPAPTVLPYMPFPTELLPEPLRGFVVLSAGSKCCDPSFVALPMLSALGAAIGGSREIQLKLDWSEPAVIWTAIVGESGDGKSPALSSVLQFLRRPEAKAAKEYEEKTAEYNAQLLRHDLALKDWKKDRPDTPPPDPPKKPTRRRFLVGDTTIEGLARLLEQNRRGLLTANDELSGWFDGFGQYRSGGRGSDEAHWLSMYGARPISFDRKGEGLSVFVARAHVCVTGGTQPGPLKRLLNQERVEEGMAARFLIAMPPRRVRKWTDIVVSKELENEVQDVFDRLLNLRGAKDEDGTYQPRKLSLSQDAQLLYQQYYEAHNVELAELTGANAAAWSKLEAIPARLALVLHLVMRSSIPEISFEAMRIAIELTRWFKYEVKRIYSFMVETEEQTRVRTALEFAQRAAGPVTARQLQHAHGGLYLTADDAKAAFEALAADGLGTFEKSAPRPKGGRPSMVFTLTTNDRTDKTPRDGGSVGSVAAAQTKPPSVEAQVAASDEDEAQALASAASADGPAKGEETHPGATSGDRAPVPDLWGDAIGASGDTEDGIDESDDGPFGPQEEKP